MSRAPARIAVAPLVVGVVPPRPRIGWIALCVPNDDRPKSRQFGCLWRVQRFRFYRAGQRRVWHFSRMPRNPGRALLLLDSHEVELVDDTTGEVIS